jgi:hypothetical protein
MITAHATMPEWLEIPIIYFAPCFDPNEWGMENIGLMGSTDQVTNQSY